MEWDQMCRDRSHHCLLHYHLADAMAHGHLEYHPKNLEDRVLVLQFHEEQGEWQIKQSGEFIHPLVAIVHKPKSQQNKTVTTLKQGCPTYGPRAESGPRSARKARHSARCGDVTPTQLKALQCSPWVKKVGHPCSKALVTTRREQPRVKRYCELKNNSRSSLLGDGGEGAVRQTGTDMKDAHSMSL
ncbi:hypothetical protein J6590_050243 [Homalodisca vitripennis]|nr:hypothetical protein J6590_050243 [Homalodisca vitripennis]